MRLAPGWSILLAALLVATSCRESGSAALGGRSRTPDIPAQDGSPAISCNEIRGGRRTTDLLLTDVRLGTHEGHDEIVFEFRPRTPPLPAGLGGTETPAHPPDPGPRYETGPATPPFAKDPSDQPFAVAGGFFLRVVVHGASGVDLSGAQPEITYRGPVELRPDHPMLKEAELESDHHGAISWILGVDDKRCWRVLESENPPRLTIEIVRRDA